MSENNTWIPEWLKDKVLPDKEESTPNTKWEGNEWVTTSLAKVKISDIPVIERLNQKGPLNKFEKLWKNDGISFGLINLMAIKIAGQGYYFEGKNKGLVKKVSEWGDRIGLSYKLVTSVIDSGIYGTYWSELLLNESFDDVVDIKALDPKKMDFYRDKEGNIIFDDNGDPKGIVQKYNTKDRIWYEKTIEHRGGEVLHNLNRKDRLRDLRKHIVYTKLITFGDSLLGISMLEPGYRSAIIRSNIADMTGESLTEDRVVLVIVKNQLRFLKFRNLWDIINEPVVLENGFEVKYPKDIFTLSDGGKFKEVKRILRHFYDGTVTRLCNYQGETETTEDHVIFTDKNELLTPHEFAKKKSNFKVIKDMEHYQKNRFPLNLLDYLNLKGKMLIDGDYIGYTPWRIGRNDPTLKFRYFTNKEIKLLIKTLAWYITEGTTTEVTIEDKSSKSWYKGYRTKISNNNKKELKELKDVMETIFTGSLKIGKYYDKRYGNYKYFVYSNSSLLHHLFKLCLTSEKEKKIPEFILNMGSDILEYLVMELVRGDGSRYKGLKYFDYSTSSRVLISQLIYIFKLLGWKYSIRYKHEKGNEKRNYCIRRISYRKNIEYKLSREEIPYEGYVYDLSVPSCEYFYEGLGLLKVHNSAFRGGGIVAYLTGNPSEEIKKKLAEDLKNITTKNVFIFSDKIQLDQVPIPDSRNIEGLIYQYADEQSGSFLIPLERILAGARVSQQDLTTKMVDFETLVEYYQGILCHQIKVQVIDRLLQVWGVEGDVYLRLRRNQPNMKLSKSRRLATYARYGLLTYDPELEIDIRKDEDLPTKFVQRSLKEWTDNKDMMPEVKKKESPFDERGRDEERVE